MLEFKGITKRYRRTRALAGLSLRVARGEIYGLLGPNGAGKSTALRIATGLVVPDEGDVLIGGESVTRNPTRALAATGALVDAPAFPGYLSGRQNLAALAMLAPVLRPDERERERVLAQVGLTGRADDRVSGYSSGMKQRLGLAAALMGCPQILILDEPTNGLDPEGRDEILATIAAVARASGGPAVLFTSHIFDEVARLCQRVGILREGELVHEGPATEAEKLREVFFTRTREVPA